MDEIERLMREWREARRLLDDLQGERASLQRQRDEVRDKLAAIALRIDEQVALAQALRDQLKAAL